MKDLYERIELYMEMIIATNNYFDDFVRSPKNGGERLEHEKNKALLLDWFFKELIEFKKR